MSSKVSNSKSLQTEKNIVRNVKSFNKNLGWLDKQKCRPDAKAVAQELLFSVGTRWTGAGPRKTLAAHTQANGELVVTIRVTKTNQTRWGHTREQDFNIKEDVMRQYVTELTDKNLTSEFKMWLYQWRICIGHTTLLNKKKSVFFCWFFCFSIGRRWLKCSVHVMCQLEAW